MTTTRRAFLRTGAAAGTGLLVGCGDTSRPAAVGPASRARTGAGAPNIVLIMTDQQRGDCVGGVSNPVLITPNIDALAGEGVTFDHCYTSAPQCKPARMSFQTGRYVHDHRIWSGSYDPGSPLDHPSHVRRVRDEAGYHTAVVGKTHLTPGDQHCSVYLSQLVDWGFTEAHEVYGPGQSANNESWYTDWLTATTPFGHQDKYERFRDYVLAWTASSPPPDVAPWNLKTEDHLDKYVAREASEWIRSWRGDSPFYLQVNFGGPHSPFDAPTPYRGKYDASDPALPDGILTAPTAPTAPLVQRLLAITNPKPPTDDTQLHEMQCSYYAKITLIDECIGQVIKALRDMKLLENTWIVLTSDHGELLGDHALTGKMAFFEGAVHVPLVVRPPGGLADPWTCSGMVEHVDVVSSILEMAGLDGDPDAPGRTLVPKIEAGADDPDAQTGRIGVISQNERNSMIRTEASKLVWDHDECRIVEFYDLVNDPQELVNLVEDPGYDVRRRALEDLLDERMAPVIPMKAGCPVEVALPADTGAIDTAAGGTGVLDTAAGDTGGTGLLDTGAGVLDGPGGTGAP